MIKLIKYLKHIHKQEDIRDYNDNVFQLKRILASKIETFIQYYSLDKITEDDLDEDDFEEEEEEEMDLVNPDLCGSQGFTLAFEEKKIGELTGGLSRQSSFRSEFISE